MNFNVHIIGTIQTAVSAESWEKAEKIINERLERFYPQWDCQVEIKEATQS